MTEKINRTSAATAARMRASEDKAAARLKARGWFCTRTGVKPDSVPPAEMQLYATNGLGETYRVMDWQMDGKPMLLGADGRLFVGIFDYVYTVGPK